MALKMKILVLCKFTPMEFETRIINMQDWSEYGVNLLRWSLKRPVYCISSILSISV